MSIEDSPRPRRNIKRIAFWSACLVASIAFWGWLLASPAKAEVFKGKQGEKIILDGRVISENWSGDVYESIIIFKKRLYHCSVTDDMKSGEWQPLYIRCHNTD